MIESKGQSFGGDWTEQKLTILEEYLNSYTTALKNSRFKLVYFDAFAGSGKIELNKQDKEPNSLFDVNEDFRRFIDGSAIRALNVTDRPFDVLVFVDTDTGNIGELNKLREDHPSREILIRERDANTYLTELSFSKSKWRGVLFLDPFGTQVSWTTIEHVASLQALDVWILFPTYAIARMLPTNKIPDQISTGLVKHLNRVFGDESWRDVYETSDSDELSGLDDAATTRQKGSEGFSKVYKSRLEALFGNRFLKETKELKHPKGAVLFELMFCVGSPSRNAVGTAKKIATHLIQRI